MSKQHPQQPEENTAQMQAFLREVDDTLHYERMQNLWQQWRFVIFAVIAALFLFVAGNEIWKTYHNDQLQQQGELFLQVANQQSIETAGEGLNELQKKGSTGFKLLALFREAGLNATAGDATAAMAIYEKIEKGGFPAEYKDLATFYKARLLAQSDMEAGKTLYLDLIEKQSLYMASAQEALALIYEQTNQRTEAQALYEQIAANPAIAPVFRQRVQARLQALIAQ